MQGMEQGEEADFRAEVFVISSDFEKCFCTGAEQQAIDDFCVLEHQWRQLMRQCEDHMDVTRREKFSSTCSDPPFPRRSLALRAVPVASASVGDEAAMPAAAALIEMPAKCVRTTAPNKPQHLC